MLQHIPQTAVIAHYVQTPRGWAVVTASGRALGASFYEIRHLYAPLFTINGAGAWVVMLPKPQPTQPPLF